MNYSEQKLQTLFVSVCVCVLSTGSRHTLDKSHKSEQSTVCLVLLLCCYPGHASTVEWVRQKMRQEILKMSSDDATLAHDAESGNGIRLK